VTEKIKEYIQTVEVGRFEAHEKASINVIQEQYVSSVSIDQIARVISTTKELSRQIKDVVQDVLEKHLGDSFNSLQDFLEIGFPPEIIKNLEACLDLVKIFM